MLTFSRSDDLAGARFRGVNLRGARIEESDLSGVVMRGVEIRDADIDAPWLSDGDTYFRVNGVDVIGFVEAELDRLFPGRSQRRAEDPAGLRDAWAALEAAWQGALDRAAALPAGSVDVSVDGEWSFAQTLRHLVLAIDMWFGGAVLEREQPYHPLGLVDVGSEGEFEAGTFTTEVPTYEEVLEAHADRVAMVRDYLATVTAEELDRERVNPHSAEHRETTRNCLQVVLEENWEHLRFALRDLEAIEARA